MTPVDIRKVTTDQILLLQKIGVRTFYETFSAYNTEENMKTYLEQSFSLEKLSAELQNPYTSFYFAWMDDAVVGYLKLNEGPAQTDVKDQNALEIERIYVLKAFHGKQVGQLLYEKAIQIAKKAQLDYVWLGVWEENSRAIRFYQKNGFVVFDKHTFWLGDDEQTDFMMKLEL
jgi:ribosomal protein S18 acetylase RimI-like enzyme